MSELRLAVPWLHLIAMAFFVGGQLFLAVAVVPVERPRRRSRTTSGDRRRFGHGMLVATRVLLATGAAMASPFYRCSDGAR
jgi:uncharacterized membrane protein